MPDLDGWDQGESTATPSGEPYASGSFAAGYGYGHDWGLRNRLNRLFDATTRHTLMLAFDHGYFQGPTSGLEYLSTQIPPLIPHVDALMCTRGGIRSSVDSATDKPIVLRVSGGQSVLTELSNEAVTVSVADALRINASAMAVQLYVGSEFEHQTILNLARVIDAGLEYGIPTLAVVGVGRDMVRDARYFGLATRIAAEMGAQLIKSYYVEEGFRKVVSRCPAPIIIAGGKKLPEFDAISMAHRALQEGAVGVDMGRNIFQSKAPVAMVRAIRGVVHDGMPPQDAYQLFNDLASPEPDVEAEQGRLTPEKISTRREPL